MPRGQLKLRKGTSHKERLYSLPCGRAIKMGTIAANKWKELHDKVCPLCASRTPLSMGMTRGTYTEQQQRQAQAYRK